MPWSNKFDDPIDLPNGRKLITLRDAAAYIRKLPKAQQVQQHWQTAVGMLINAAEGEPAWMMMARMAMGQALNHGKERVFSDRKETHWGKRKLKRDQ